MTYKINVGDHIPHFSSIDAEGESFTSDDVLGSPFVLYFYPQDDTPGCTKEACAFRDSIEMLDNLDAIVIGVSPDGISAHQKFIQNHNLNFTLLCDEKKTFCQQFDVLRDKQTVERTTFVIDGEGIVRWVERPVSVEGHVTRVIKALQDLSGE